MKSIFNFFKKNSILLSDDDKLQISDALSFIWAKFQYHLKNIAINDHSAVLNYRRHIDRLTVNLEKGESSTYNNNNNKDLEV